MTPHFYPPVSGVAISHTTYRHTKKLAHRHTHAHRERELRFFSFYSVILIYSKLKVYKFKPISPRFALHDKGHPLNSIKARSDALPGCTADALSDKWALLDHYLPARPHLSQLKSMSRTSPLFL